MDISDLCGLSRHFKTKSPDALTVGIVGLNTADHYVSFEGARKYPTGAYGPHPFLEAPEAEVVQVMLGVASKQVAEQELAEWLRGRLVPVMRRR